MNPLLSSCSQSMAEAAAAALQAELDPVCERSCIAGSIRRDQPFCRVIELVVVPRVTLTWAERRATKTTCRGMESIVVDQLHELCQTIRMGKHPRLVRPIHEVACSTPHWGERSKDLLFWHRHRWFPARLWISCSQSFGLTLALRTGDLDFANLLITPAETGGALPPGLRQRMGRLERLEMRRGRRARWEPAPTPEEQDFFDLLGLPLLLPRARTECRLRAILSSREPGVAHAASA